MTLYQSNKKIMTCALIPSLTRDTLPQIIRHKREVGMEIVCG